MMRFNILLLVLLAACNNAPVSNETASLPDTGSVATEPVKTSDTLVGKKDVTKVIPGSEQLKLAYSYAVIAGPDTSSFKCHFSQWKVDNTLFFVTKFSKTLTYRQQKNELVKILAEAHKDFGLSALNTIGIGRLVSTGDLAVKVSQQFYAIKFQSELNAFLLRSALAEDMNALLKPYNMAVKEVVTEKQVFLPHADLPEHSVIETPPKEITDEIVDCIVYLKIGPVASPKK